MVVELTKRKIDELKERPHHERRAVAAMIAIGVVAVLFLGWSFTFVSGFREALVASSAPAAAQQEGVAHIGDVPRMQEGEGAFVRIQSEAQAAAAASGYVVLDEDGYQLVPAQ